MVKKYTDNYRLDIAHATIFRNLKAIEEIPIHTALDITSGDNLTKKDMVSGEHIVYGGGGETGNTHSEFNIDYKTIGIGRVGARCGCVFEIIPNSWVTDNALIIQSYDNRFSLSFLRHFLSYSDLGQYANNAMQPVISKTRINNVTIPLIDIDEQNTLSKILDSIEKNEKFESNDYDLLKSKIKIIDNWETLNVEIETQKDLTAQLKQSILQEAIQGQLTEDWRAQNPNTEPASELLKRIKAEKAQLIKDKKLKKEKALPPITEEEIPFELPEGWVWCRLGTCSINRDELRKPISQKERERKAKVYDYYGASGCIDKIDDYTHDGSFLLIGEDGSNLRLRATPIAFEVKGKFWVNNHAHTIQFIDSITQLYIQDHINGIDLKPYITGGFQPKLNQANLNKILIALPPLEEQKAIVEKVKSLMQKCQALEEEIKTSEANAQMLMQAVLKEAFEGKKEVVEV